ncbi:MAG: hypothetical protein LUD17_06250 [Bacteroidales bacterium]|nr:hypothetical protein [Bacteroidales bacterium]
MAYYIKVRKEIAKEFGLLSRGKIADGSYLLWQNDMTRLGPMWKFQENLARIGGVALTPEQAAKERVGVLCTEMPIPTDDYYKSLCGLAEQEETSEEEPTGEADA